MSFARILTDQEERLLAQEREALAELRDTLARLEGEDDASFKASFRQLDELFLLVVAGEFNSGKSAFINALLGERLLEEGVTPTTERITLVRHGEEKSSERESDAFEVVSAPLEVLEKVNIVDTPGTNAIHRQHETITRDFIPRADMVLFITSADRPFTESERGFLESIRDWGKKIVVAVNKIDILDSDADVERVVAFVKEGGATLLGVAPEVFPVSSRKALQAQLGEDGASLEESRFGPLESFIVSTLDDRERVRLKLLNPIGVGQALADKYLGVVDTELSLLKDDLRMIEQIDRQLELYEADQNRDFAYRLSDIDNALLDFENRGVAYFEETMRLGRIFDLANKAKIKSDFERQVVADLPQEIEKRVESVIDWMVEAELRQWKSVVEDIEARRSAYEEKAVGRLARTFDQDRKRLLETVGAAARRVIDDYDHDKESTRLADSVQAAVASAALLEAGAVGIGALVAAIATSSAVDVTGILAAGAVSVLGFLVIPAKKRRAKADLTKRVAEVREKLMGSLRHQFEGAMKRSVARIQDAIAPYTRFVRAERGRLASAREDITRSAEELSRLRARVEEL